MEAHLVGPQCFQFVNFTVNFIKSLLNQISGDVGTPSKLEAVFSRNEVAIKTISSTARCSQFHSV